MVGPAVDDHGLRIKEGRHLGGGSMRQRKEDDIMPGEGVRIRFPHDPVAQWHQLGLVRTQ
jgi:hypothetical protein